MFFKCINFDDKFADFTAKFVKEHAKEYRNYDAMEADMPRIYMAFLNTPARWLNNVTPGAYFTQFEDPKDLVDWLQTYCAQGVPVPDLLCEQIVSVGKPCEKRLLAMLKEEEAPAEAKMTAISLLREMESTQPKMLYISWQLDRKDDDELADNALDSLRDMGKSAVQPMVEALPKANDAGQAALIDVLCEYPNEQVFRVALRIFNENPRTRALFASYLAKIGDERALDDLIRVANDENTGYIDFIEIRNAIEALGGNCPERDFEDDEDFEALHRAGD